MGESVGAVAQELGPFARSAKGMRFRRRSAPPKMHRVSGRSPKTRLIVHKISIMKTPRYRLVGELGFLALPWPFILHTFSAWLRFKWRESGLRDPGDHSPKGHRSTASHRGLAYP